MNTRRFYTSAGYEEVTDREPEAYDIVHLLEDLHLYVYQVPLNNYSTLEVRCTRCDKVAKVCLFHNCLIEDCPTVKELHDVESTSDTPHD